MRYASIVISIMLLGALATAHAKQAGETAASEVKCPIAPDPQWTKQEIFVWTRVCIGKDADFNEGADYGGDLDPKSPSGLPASRILRPSFLQALLLDDKYRNALTRSGVKIIGARFTEEVDLDNAELRHQLWLDKSLLENGASLNRLRTTRLISFNDSKINGELDLDGSRIDDSLYLDNAQFATVKMGDAHIGASLSMGEVAITGALDMSGLRVDGSLFMGRKAKFAAVTLLNAHVGGGLFLVNSQVVGQLAMHGIHIAANLRMGGSEFSAIGLSGAQIGGFLGLQGATVTGTLDMDKINVGSSLLMENGGKFANIALTSAHIGTQLSFINSTVSEKLDMRGMRVDGALHMEGPAKFVVVDMFNAAVHNGIFLDHAQVTGRLHMDRIQVPGSITMKNSRLEQVELTHANIGGRLDFTGAMITGTLRMVGLRVNESFVGDGAKLADADLDEAHVVGPLSLHEAKVSGIFSCANFEVDGIAYLDAEFFKPVLCLRAKFKQGLVLGRGIFHANADFAGSHIDGELHFGARGPHSSRWAEDSTLDVRGAYADVIPAIGDAWPPHLDADGFVYRALRKTDTAEPASGKSDNVLDAWLSSQAKYSPRVYEQLATVFHNHGDGEVASYIRYASKERERSESSGIRYVNMTILKLVIGYGYHIERSIIWILGLIALGAVVLLVSGEGSRNRMPYGISYSFDMLLPVIKLRDAHYQVDVRGWPRYYFYVHKIAGFVLASFLIAGISGLTK